ncbi:MAG: type II toxin-antitoxin system prevent-host-death family antitoxin [Tepidisphaeraceae bacterium]|jgi:prevent-host-death family protein
METIGAFEAKTRLSELLERTEHGEAFQITKHGRPVGRLMPPEGARDRKASAAAVARLKAMSGFGGKMSREELKSMIHEGHRL